MGLFSFLKILLFRKGLLKKKNFLYISFATEKTVIYITILETARETPFHTIIIYAHSIKTILKGYLKTSQERTEIGKLFKSTITLRRCGKNVFHV